MHRCSTLVFIALAAIIALPATPARAQNMLGGLPIDGIRCDYGEGAALHIHANLQMFDRGRQVTVPGNIGIPLGVGCLYWLHTHSNNGMIHIESPVNQLFTLGQFFDIWAVPLSRTQAGRLRAPRGGALRFTVNGHVWTRDPKLIPLRNHEAVVISAGPPFASGSKPNWGSL
ncbi:MAG TPA: hypothetical protein VFO29_08090 [Candidatus Rubrimentiphilum sp.]|nr:hypothetical protein [Candidatus Rubrimentiphilum sp.]